MKPVSLPRHQTRLCTLLASDTHSLSLSRLALLNRTWPAARHRRSASLTASSLMPALRSAGTLLLPVVKRRRRRRRRLQSGSAWRSTPAATAAPAAVAPWGHLREAFAVTDMHHEIHMTRPRVRSPGQLVREAPARLARARLRRLTSPHGVLPGILPV